MALLFNSQNESNTDVFFSFTFKFDIHGLYNSFDVVNVHEFSTTGTDVVCLFVEKISRQKTD